MFIKNMINLQTILVRELIIKSIREFFYAQHFHEVIIPVFNNTVPLEPNIHPFTTQWRSRKGTTTLYLTTSPERRLKQMISLGIEKCFAIGSSFRNLENSGSLHSPEFLMLEWYRKNKTYTVIMDDIQNLLEHIYNLFESNKKLGFIVSGKWKKISLITLYSQLLKHDFNEILENEDMIFKIAQQKGYNTNNATWDELYDQIFVNEIEPELPVEPFFLIDFPSRVSPLCKPKKENENIAERFELYIKRIEIANGNTENTKAGIIKKHFLSEQKKRRTIQPIDKKFLKSIEKMKDATYAGVGLGVDRLTMLFSGSVKIEELETLV